MISNPFFSIIVPAYNVDKYISRTITSILNNTFNDIEIIIVNDGSTDNTINIINNFAKIHENISIINHSKNESLHMARMSGINNAKGKYILFLDGDDYFENNALPSLYNFIKNNPNFNICEFGYKRIPSNKIVLPDYFKENRFTAYISDNNCPAYTMWNKAYENNFIKNAFSNMQNIYFNNIEDIYESIIISYYTNNIIYFNEVITIYSIGTGISTIIKNYNQIIEYIKSIKILYENLNIFFKNNNLCINLNNLIFKLFSNVYIYINYLKNDDDKKNAFVFFINYFNIELIQEYLYSKDILKIDEMRNHYYNIIKSKDYLIGRLILSPLRNIKKLFFKK